VNGVSFSLMDFVGGGGRVKRMRVGRLGRDRRLSVLGRGGSIFGKDRMIE